MKLNKKKELAARTLNVGKHRIVFVKTRIEEIKEAITKQDIRDLHKDKAILIKQIKGRKKVIKRKRRGPGKIKKKVKDRKQRYVKETRKLRKILANAKEQGRISGQQVKELRKKIRNRLFKSSSAFKSQIGVKK